MFERAVRRADNAGAVIDIFLELLCYKLEFSSDFLKVSCAPVDLFRLLANPTTETDIPHHTAEQVVQMEALRRLMEQCHHQCNCLPKHSVVVCPKNKPSLPKIPEIPESDIQEVEASLLTNLQAQLSSNREAPIESRVRRKHLRDVYDNPPSKPRKR